MIPGLQELDESIQKWKDIVSGHGEDNGPRNCACCQAFGAEECEGCPIETFAARDCIFKEYEEWADYHEENMSTSWVVFNYESRHKANAMLTRLYDIRRRLIASANKEE